MPSWWRMSQYVLAGLFGLAGVVYALVQLLAPAVPLRIQHTWLDRTPVTVFSSRQHEVGPAVVLVHDFAGSQQLMLPFAVTLARNGYTTITFDFPGHGRNGSLLPTENAGRQEQTRELASVLDKVVAFARQHPRSDGRVALIGHGLGADTAVYYAQLQDQIPSEQIESVVALSKAYAGVTPLNPRNLLVINGALEFWLWDNTRQVASQTGVRLGETTGNFQQGTARQVRIVPWVEHTAILFNPTAVKTVQDWIDQSFQRPPSEETFYLNNRGLWIALLYGAATLLFWPFSLLLKPIARAKDQPVYTRPVPRKWWFGLALAPVVLTPLVVRLLPIDNWLHIPVGSSLALHFAVYGVFTAAGLVVYRFVQKETPVVSRPEWPSLRAPVTMALLVVVYVFVIVGVPDQIFVFNYFPPVRRIMVVPLIFVAMLPYFLADERLTRAPGAPLGSYAITKVFFLASLGLDALMNENLLYLVVLLPVFALYFIVYGLFSQRIYQRTGTILVGALASSLIFAWVVAAIFPMTV